jgi:hypothetical protein
VIAVEGTHVAVAVIGARAAIPVVIADVVVAAVVVADVVIAGIVVADVEAARIADADIVLGNVNGAALRALTTTAFSVGPGEGDTR